MAAVDSLVGLIELRKADGLVLEAGRVPTLLGGPGGGALTMPPLDGSLMAIFLEELLTPEQSRSVNEGQIVESEYRSPNQGSFIVKTRVDAGRAKMTIRRGVLRQASHSSPKPPGHDGAIPEVHKPAVLPPLETPGVDKTTERQTPAMAATDAPAPLHAQAVSLLQQLLTQTRAHGASDLLLSAGRTPVMKLRGDLIPLPATSLSDQDIAHMFAPSLSPARQEQLANEGSVDFGLHLDADGSRFRVNLFRQLQGLAAAIRPIAQHMPDLVDLALPRSLLRVVSVPHGLVILAGPTGAGKSTTMAALLEQINRTRACHVITLEDPIEYQFRQGQSTFHQREVGTHVASFSAGLRAALRESPDIIFVGEMRDAETIALALTAAETGHLVLSTLHAGSGVGAIERMINAFAEPQRAGMRAQVAASLRFLITQHLLPSSDGTRIPVVEQIAVNHAVAAQIRDGRMHLVATQMEVGGDDGMVTLEASLVDLVRKGRINAKAALSIVPNRDAFEALLAAPMKSRNPL